MRVSHFTPALVALVSILAAAPSLADDPRDPKMQSRAAREADAAEIRRLNREQAAFVQRRDARYAQGWKAWRENEAARADDENRAYGKEMHRYQDARRAADADRDAYARARRDYAAAMDDWRRDVADCRAGYYERCAR